MKWLLPSIATFAVVLVVSVVVLNPIYGDEIYYRSILGTNFRNEFRRITIYPDCSSSFLSKLPFSWYPSAFILEQLYNLTTSPLSLRILGAIVGCLNCIMLGVVVSSRFPKLDRMSAYATGILFLGIFPFYLVLGRPEGLVLLGVLSVLVLSRFKPSSHSPGNLFQQSVVLCLLALTLPLHPTALFFLPTFGYALLSRRCSWISRTFGLLVFGVLVFQSVTMHAQLISCPENPVISAHWGNIRGVDYMSSYAPLTFVKTRLHNLSGSLYSIGFLIPSTNHRNFGITPQVNTAGNLPEVIILGVIGFSVITGALALILRCLRRLCLSFAAWDSSVLPLGAYLALLVSIAGGLSIQPDQYAYRLTLWVPLVLVLAAVSYKAVPVSLPRPLASNMSGLFVITFLTSVTSFCSIYLPLVRANLFHMKTNYPSLSSGIFSPATIEADMENISRFCPTKGVSPDFRTAVDQVTYWYFLNFRVHLFWNYLLESHGENKESLMNMVADGLDQIVVECSDVPVSLQEEGWIRSGQICCLPRSVLKK